MKSVESIAIIPARGGSKRIPHKNIKNFCGQAIIGYSIQAAHECDCFDRVIVSTDCPDIARIAREFGAETPFIRPADISDDHASTLPVIRHAIQFCEEESGNKLKHACCLYATAPFVRAEDLRHGHETLTGNKSVEFAFSVTSFPFPIQRALYIDPATSQTRMFSPEHEQSRSQDLQESYHDAGQFYWGTRDAFIQHDGIFTAHSMPVILPRERVQDIDTPEDWRRAELMFNALRQTPHD
ncbi:MAG: pseudaminic acid cytidylyltransferase [Akkermansiaceae bacterium]